MRILSLRLLISVGGVQQAMILTEVPWGTKSFLGKVRGGGFARGDLKNDLGRHTGFRPSCGPHAVETCPVIMRIFFCQQCGERLFFENTICLTCGSALGFLPGSNVLSALTPDGHGNWLPLAPEAGGALQHQCHNYARENVCNWLVPAAESDDFCLACALNRTI